MATLKIEATPSAGLDRYAIGVDGMTVPMRSDNKGVVAVLGKCGDRSKHVLTYSFIGPAGQTLSIKVLCDGTQVAQVVNAKVFPAREPYGSGHEDFLL